MFRIFVFQLDCVVWNGVKYLVAVHLYYIARTIFYTLFLIWVIGSPISMRATENDWTVPNPSILILLLPSITTLHLTWTYLLDLNFGNLIFGLLSLNKTWPRLDGHSWPFVGLRSCNPQPILGKCLTNVFIKVLKLEVFGFFRAFLDIPPTCAFHQAGHFCPSILHSIVIKSALGVLKRTLEGNSELEKEDGPPWDTAAVWLAAATASSLHCFLCMEQQQVDLGVIYSPGTYTTQVRASWGPSSSALLGNLKNITQPKFWFTKDLSQKSQDTLSELLGQHSPLWWCQWHWNSLNSYLGFCWAKTHTDDFCVPNISRGSH